MAAELMEHLEVQGAVSNGGQHPRPLMRRIQGVEARPDWQHAITTMYSELRLELCRYLHGLGMAIEAEDVIQETFFRLARHLQRGNRIENMRAWVFQVAYNLSMDIHRASRRACVEANEDAADHPGIADCRSNPEWVYLQKERVRRVRMAFSRLTPRQFRSVQLRIKGLRYREIAADLRISEQRAVHLVKRALVRLAEG